MAGVDEVLVARDQKDGRAHRVGVQSGTLARIVDRQSTGRTAQPALARFGPAHAEVAQLHLVGLGSDIGGEHAVQALQVGGCGVRDDGAEA